ncbi:protein-disulfide reductase DsbD family protein [Hyphomonas sp. FCG-A18]|uniref:protein-disulfide reductase DsbD family protein n=1 Tax=Hyphomonas sp. FCG-A18 TaxID=3080019 RepID=UPI002B2B13E2|nr:protein-disulfide reductase DsbD family protein [Hyphomonas sp. FCG-A18]
MMAFIRLALSLFMLAAAFIGTANAQKVDGGHATVELVSERAVAMPGETFYLGLSFELDEKWHIYWKNAGDAGLPPVIAWGDYGPPAALTEVEDFHWPTPELLPVVPGQIMDYGYSNQVVLPFAVTLADDATGPVDIAMRVDYLICYDICIPESVDLRLLQSVGAGQVPDTYGGTLIQSGLLAQPPAFDGEAALTKQGDVWVLSAKGAQLAGLSGEARFFPEGHEIVHAADQPVSFGEDGLQLRLTPAKSDASVPDVLKGVIKVGETAVDVTVTPGAVLSGTEGSGAASFGAPVNLPLLIGLALIGGLILNLMPCVLPVLSIKAMGMVSAAANGHAGEARSHGLWYTAGVLLSFAALAAAILAVRAATGVATWGFWLQDPVVVTVLILIIFMIGLWLLGLFELGSSVQNVGSGLAAKQGPAGAFFTGVLATIVGAPCVGPFLGAALGAVFARPAFEVVTVLMAMGLGLALPFLILSFVPSLQRLLPKPGAWMETLKQVFAFPMFLTAAWLLSVLGALAGYRTAAIVVAGAALVGFGLWAFRTAGKGAKAILLSILGLAVIIPAFMLIGATSGTDLVMGLIWLAVIVGGFVAVVKAPAGVAGGLAKGLAGLAIVAGLLWPVMQSRVAAENTTPGEAYAAKYETEVWSPERVAELVAEGRPIFIDFTAEWCAICQANKLQTLQTRPVTEAFEAANVAFLVADYTRPDPVIAAELQKHGRAGVPLYLWYPAGQSEPEVLPEALSISLVTGLVEGR